MSLNKPEILIIVSSERPSEFVGRISYKEKIQLKKFRRMTITVFRYTKPQQFKTTPALKDIERNVGTSMKTKMALVCKSAFPSPPISFHSDKA